MIKRNLRRSASVLVMKKINQRIFSIMNQATNIKPTRVRFGILAAIFVNVVINYMDRSNISVAGPVISEELNLSSVQMGLIFSAFAWTYAALQIPGGIMADRLGLRIVYTFCVILWSVVTRSEEHTSELQESR